VQTSSYSAKLKRLWRLARFHYTQRIKGFDTPTEPHLDPDADRAFRDALAKCTAYLEFGSGGSSILVDRMRKPGSSIDSDRYYAAAVRKGLSANSSIEIIDVDVGFTGPWGTPYDLKPTPHNVARWRRYIDQPFAVYPPDRPFPDLVLVDGRFRRACILETARQAQLRGATAIAMFDDYFDVGRDHYHAVELTLGSPQRHGRAALFTIGKGMGVRPVSTDDVAEAIRDPL
jgi:hypothetical protein